MKLRHPFLVCIFLFAASTEVYCENISSNSSDAVYRYFSNLNTFHANFRQQVKDSKGEDIQESTGEVWLAKPGKFRWDYQLPFVQQVVANGKELWTYDPDLEQATVKTIDEALSMSPAMLLSGAKKLDEVASVKPIGITGKEYWFRLTPLNTNESIDAIEIAFLHQQLYAIRILDGFMNTTTITFSEQSLNQPLKDNHFSVQLPEGTDVLGSP
ncbi:MAG: outer membrane lipoprotein chaperone LolA [Gammaproteobacteria bacterium]